MDILEIVENVENPAGVDMVHIVDICFRPIFREVPNPLDTLTNEEFRQRFYKETVTNVILPLIINDVAPNDSRGLPLSPVIKLLVCLRFYASGSYQIVCGDLEGVSQSTVSRVVTKVSTLLAQRRGDFIKFPFGIDGLNALKQDFQVLGTIRDGIGLPHVIGAVDGCYIPIQRPPVAAGLDPESFRNRKNYFPINVQAAVGPDMRFLNLVARWPGREHDSRIFNNSRLKIRLESGELDGQLLGDNGYPSLWLFNQLFRY